MTVEPALQTPSALIPAGRPSAVRIGAAIAVLSGALAGALVLELLSGGIRIVALSPAVAAASLGAFGCVIAWHRPANRLGPLLMISGLGFAVGTLAAGALDFGTSHPIPTVAAQACFATVSLSRVFIAAWVLFILWFPDGSFTARRWQRFSVASAALCAAVAALVWLLGPPDRVFDFYRGTDVPVGAAGPMAGTWPDLAGLSNLLMLLPLVALWSLVQRYRNSQGVRRQQIRWLLLALAVDVAVQITGAALVSSTPGGVVRQTGSLLGIVVQPLPMLAAAVAVLRYRLWDIDLVLSRAAVYGVLWACLSGLLLVPPLAAGLLVGGQGAAAAVGIALLVTVVFQPARRRLEAVVERLVYRHRVRPYQLLSGFWTALRHADLDRFGPLVADAIQTGLGVAWAGVWMYAEGPHGGVLRRMSGTSTGGEETCEVSGATAGQLLEAPARVLGSAPPDDLVPLWGTPPEAVLPLVADGTLVGVIACGGRRGDRLRAADFEALELLAREASLRLQNLRLDAQLRQRLAQIETQAAELLASRQRLVGAQHEERRRIERNLHDGVQQQLVALVVRLRNAAEVGDPQLAELATEAEEAMFALQELARGIYPSVLADRGLLAALRTQAARMPLSVRIAADDGLAGRRLDAEVEAALYFVALEALTNAQKHAPQARVTVRLREDGGVVRLEVADDGPGIVGDRGRGSGLQNMSDRVAAAGGTLEVRSAPGDGTRIVAAIPTEEVIGTPVAQPVDADSRR
jgi:signal transduction histidine kinase